MSWTHDELEAMRLADEEIDREFAGYPAKFREELAISKYLERRAIDDRLTAAEARKRDARRAKYKQPADREKQKAASSAYYHSHKEYYAAYHKQRRAAI
jgi:hypothetical protein